MYYKKHIRVYKYYSICACTRVGFKPEHIMLLVLPIIPSRNSQNFYPLFFLFYSHAITYYSCYILYILC